MSANGRSLRVLPFSLAIAKLDAATPWPDWLADGLWSVTRTPDELSIVCEEGTLPSQVHADRGWCALAVEGPIELTAVGVLASLAVPLRDANVSIFAVSTFDTDYVLVRLADLEGAIGALEDAGWAVQSS